MLDIKYTTGFAGSGKSKSLLDLLDTLRVDNTIVLAPTHKALDRLRKELKQDFELRTIHSILGWIPTINEDASHVNHVDATCKLDKPMEYYKHIIIDEAGMMNEDMLYEMIEKIEVANPEAQLHLFLDPYQLLPVKGYQIQIDPDSTTELNTQYRAESPDIVRTFMKFVDFLRGTNTEDLKIEESDNIIFAENIKNFKEGDKVLGFTNNCVGNYNKLIAAHLGIKGYEGQEVQLGNEVDTIIVDKFIEPTIQELLEGFKNGTLKLQNSNINSMYLEASLQALIDNKTIEFILSGNTTYCVIAGVDRAYKARNDAKDKAVQNKKMFKHVYALNRAFTMDYIFASTVHKSQGQEWNTVFVAQTDIKKAIKPNYYMTYARLMYVALSRAKNKIYII